MGQIVSFWQLKYGFGRVEVRQGNGSGGTRGDAQVLHGDTNMMDLSKR